MPKVPACFAILVCFLFSAEYGLRENFSSLPDVSRLVLFAQWVVVLHLRAGAWREMPHRRWDAKRGLGRIRLLLCSRAYFGDCCD